MIIAKADEMSRNPVQGITNFIEIRGKFFTKEVPFELYLKGWKGPGCFGQRQLHIQNINIQFLFISWKKQDFRHGHLIGSSKRRKL